MPAKYYVQAQLTADGIALAGGHPMRISSGNHSIVFNAGAPTRLDRDTEWNGFLARYHTADGKLLFQLVPGSSVEVVQEPAPALLPPSQQHAEEPSNPAAPHHDQA